MKKIQKKIVGVKDFLEGNCKYEKAARKVH